MMSWEERATEDLALFNPSFCAILLWEAVEGYAAGPPRRAHAEVEPLYLVLPLVLHGETRRTLPRSARTSLASWVSTHPLLCLLIAERARVLVPFTREAINFGGRYSLLAWAQDGMITALPEWSQKIDDYRIRSTSEVQDCVKKAAFVGKWFRRTGDASTIMATLGVRP